MANRDVIADLVAQVSLDGTQFQQGVGKVNRQLKQVKEEFKTAQQRTKLYGESMDNLESKSSILSNQLKLQKSSVELLDKAYKEAVASGGAYSKTAQNLAIRLERAKREMMGTQKQIEDVNRELVEQNGLLVTNRNLWGRAFDNLSEHIKNSKHELEGLQNVMAGGLIAAGVGFGAAVYSAASFEQALADVKAISGATGDEMAQLSKLAKDLGETTRYSGKQVLEGAQELIKAGVSLEDVMGGALKGALDLATAGELDLAEAAEIASTALNAFEKDNLSVSDAADILAGAANASATDVREMQYGLSQASATASATGLSFEETATALATLAMNGLRGSDAGTSLKTMLMRLIPETNKAKEAFKELGLITEDGANQFFDAEGNIKDFSEIVGILHDSLDELNPKQRSAALKELFGTDAYRAGAIFFKEAASGVEEMNKAMKETTAAEVAAIRMDTFLGKLEELKSTLATLGIEVADDAMDGLTDTVKELTGFVKDLDPEMVALGLKAVGAAAGFGLMATTLVKVSRGLMLLSANPIGLAITGISLLVGAFVGLNGAMEKANEVSFERYNKLSKEQQALQKSIDTYDRLRNKTKLSTDELLRYMDIQTKLQSTTDPTVIEELQKQMGELQKKSGLSKDELNKLIEANNTLIDQAPTTKTAISEQGNAMAKSAEAAKALNKEKLEEIRNELKLQALRAEANVQDHIQAYQQAAEDFNNSMSFYNQALIRQAEIEQNIRTIEAEIQAARESGNERVAQQLQQQLDVEKFNLEVQKDQVLKEAENKEEARKTFQEKEKILNKDKEVYKQMAQNVLQQVGLNSELGKENQAIQTAINKLESKRQKIIDNAGGVDNLNSKQQESINKIDSQIQKYQNAGNQISDLNSKQGSLNGQIEIGKDKAEDLGRELSEDEYKNLEFTGDNLHDAQAITNELDKDVVKEVTIWQKVKRTVSNVWDSINPFDNNADGTNFFSHPSGMSWLGEEGAELVKHGNKWAMADFGLYKLPYGSQVFTHDESKRILSALNSVPGYAGGISRSGEVDRVISSLGKASQSNSVGNDGALVDAILALASRPVSLSIDGREIVRFTHEEMTEFQERNKNYKSKYARR